jgi:hypothetical protein
VFGTTGGLTHTTLVTGLTGGSSHTVYVLCADSSNTANLDDFVISFTVAAAGTVTASSSFVGTETPLSEQGMWDSPGAWGIWRRPTERMRRSWRG